VRVTEYLTCTRWEVGVEGGGIVLVDGKYMDMFVHC
jgi:hypothetical protein